MLTVLTETLGIRTPVSNSSSLKEFSRTGSVVGKTKNSSADISLLPVGPVTCQGTEAEAESCERGNQVLYHIKFWFKLDELILDLFQALHKVFVCALSGSTPGFFLLLGNLWRFTFQLRCFARRNMEAVSEFLRFAFFQILLQEISPSHLPGQTGHSGPPMQLVVRDDE